MTIFSGKPLCCIVAHYDPFADVDKFANSANSHIRHHSTSIITAEHAFDRTFTSGLCNFCIQRAF